MKTIITTNIDGYDVITQMDNAGKLIDPVATAKIVAVEMEKEDVWKKINDLKSQISEYAKAAYQAKKDWRKAKSQTEREKCTQIFKDAQAGIKNITEKLQPLAVELKEVNKNLTLKHAVYFQPAPYETIITDEEADAISTLLATAESEGVVITKDKKKVADNRGKNYFKKSGKEWTRYEMLKLGDVPPKGAVQDKDLTQEQQIEIGTQFETERIAKLSKADKAKELETVTNNIKAQAIQMRSGLEIDGDAKALSKAQDWLADEIGKAEERYS